MQNSDFIAHVNSYHALSNEAVELISSLSQERAIKKGKTILEIGTIPKSFYYVVKGLFSYSYLTETGENIIKIFFPENTFVASLSATIYKKPSLFHIQALEDSVVLEIDSGKFRELLFNHHEIALFYIKYLEKKWVEEKELGEITSKYEIASLRYQNFLASNSHLAKRLKQHHIASYLGITATQLSRIKKSLKKT